MARGTTYSEEEDFSICRAYVSVSTDPIIGADQKGGNFWQRVFEVFKIKHCEVYPDKPYNAARTKESIMARWKRPIACDCKDMDNIRKATEIPSGFNEMQYRDLLSAKFADTHNKRKFSHWSQLEYLQVELKPLFAQGLKATEAVPPEVQGLMRTVAEQIDGEDGSAVVVPSTEEDGDAPALVRPIGAKKAKKRLAEERREEYAKKNKVNEPASSGGGGGGFVSTLVTNVSNAIDRIGSQVAAKANGAVFLTMSKLALDLNKRDEAERYFLLAQQTFDLPNVSSCCLLYFSLHSSLITYVCFLSSSASSPTGDTPPSGHTDTRVSPPCICFSSYNREDPIPCCRSCHSRTAFTSHLSARPQRTCV